MGYLRRTSLPDGCFQITTRGVNRGAIYRGDPDRWYFLELLLDCIVRDDLTCHLYCLMTNHYHLLITAAQEDLSRAMQRLNGKYARWFNRRHGRKGHLFGERFASWIVDTEDHFDNAVGYILENPVRAGLCKRAEDWPWSAVDERTFAR